MVWPGVAVARGGGRWTDAHGGSKWKVKVWPAVGGFLCVLSGAFSLVCGSLSLSECHRLSYIGSHSNIENGPC